MFNNPDKKQDGPLTGRVARIADKPPLNETEYDRSGSRRERAPREATFKPAALTLNGGGRMDVVVKNISCSGARIEFVPKVTLPDQVLVAEPTLKIRTWALVIWQGGGAAGLKFVAG